MFKRTSCLKFLLCMLLGVSGPTGAAVISAGEPTTTVPGHLTDGSYLFGITVTLDADQFLLPVEITGAANLQSWQFDVLFDNTVVQEVDPGDGTSGIYGAEFVPGDANTLSFILGGFPFNLDGLIDNVAGSHPVPPFEVSGDGVLAYILFDFVAGQQGNDPNFTIDDTVVQQRMPEPGTLALLAAGLLILTSTRRGLGGVRLQNER